MIRSATLRRLMLIGIVALTSLGTMSTSAHAGHGRGQGHYKGDDRDWRWAHSERGPVVVRGSSAGPAIAGLVGGFLLGQAYGHGHSDHVVVHECAPPPRYRYYDPYDDEYYGSLDDCPAGYCGHHRARVVRVIECSSGRSVGAMQWSDGGWRSCDDRDYGREQRYDQRDYRDQRYDYRDQGSRWSHDNQDEEDDQN